MNKDKKQNKNTYSLKSETASMPYRTKHQRNELQFLKQYILYPWRAFTLNLNTPLFQFSTESYQRQKDHARKAPDHSSAQFLQLCPLHVF